MSKMGKPFKLTTVTDSKCFGGRQQVHQHESVELGCKMLFSIFLPSSAGDGSSSQLKLPVVYYLSGLTCTEQNMITKSGIQQWAEKYQLIIVGPDTSPRGCKVPGEDEFWDLGTGAGFYVDSTQEPWRKNYRMYSYVTQELRQVVEKNFGVVDAKRIGITGHSMGGHGALVAFLRNPDVYKAVSAFAPIANPTKSSWGVKSLRAYLGDDQTAWADYDATELIKKQPRKDVKIVIDQGTKDEWMNYLVLKNFVKACEDVGQPVEINDREGYDHGYYFVSTFIENHLKHFSDSLRA